MASGLIDYNFHCFRQAIQDVFEVKKQADVSENHVTTANSDEHSDAEPLTSDSQEAHPS